MPGKVNVSGERLIAAGLLGVVLLATLAGCEGGYWETPGAAAPRGGAAGHGDGDVLYPKLPKVTGRIDEVDAEPENPRYFRRLRISDARGRSWEFGSEGWVGVSVGHLKDHQIQGVAVTVWYETGPDGRLLARFVGD